MTRRKAPKAKTMKILDEATMTYKVVNLYNVVFSTTKPGETATVQVYSPTDAEVMDVAGRLYARRGSFGVALSFERVR
jgi:hypothetical protein